VISVSVEIREGPVPRQVWITTPPIERALRIAGGEVPGRTARLVFPLDPGGRKAA
jgi:hypothetical protein